MPESFQAAAESVCKKLQKRGLTAVYTPGARALETNIPTHKPEQSKRISLEIFETAAADMRACASFAEGVASVLLAPKQVAMQELAFETAAERLLMRLEGPLFMEGVRAAGGDQPLSQGWFDGLEIVYWLDLDRGPRVVSRKRFEAWNVSLDQVHCGARSLLFHRSRDVRFGPLEGFEGVEVVRVGDGFEAGRVLVLEEMDWSRVADGLRCAVPDKHTLLVQTLPKPSEALERAVARLFEDATHPLSRHIFVQRGSSLA